MKKTLVFLTLIATLILALALTACGNSETTTSQTTTNSSSLSTDTTAPGSDTTPESTAVNILVTAYEKPEEYVTLPEFSTITVSNALINKDVEAYLEQVLDYLGKDDFKVVDSGVSAILGDSVNIYYTGRAKDETVNLSESTLAGMTNATNETGYDLILGSGNFIPGFEEQLIGAKAGDTVTVDVTFPETYSSEELQGVAVLFEVKVNTISRATAGDENVLFLSVLYSLKNETENSDLAAFMEGHEVEFDMADLETPFDDCFSAELIRTALLGKTLYGTATVEVTMPLSVAQEFGYDHELTLTAMITVEQIVYYPKELTDEDINAYTGGEYPTVEAFRKYVTDHYKINYAYEAVVEAATYGKIPDDVYALLCKPYYDQMIYNLVGDISGMTEAELAETLTDDIIKQAEDFAKENAVAEYNDRMLTAYLAQKTHFVMTDEIYQNSLTETFNYYMTNYYFQMLMNNITTEEAFETYFGKETLTFQFTFDEVVTLLAEKVTYVD